MLEQVHQEKKKKMPPISHFKLFLGYQVIVFSPHNLSSLSLCLLPIKRSNLTEVAVRLPREHVFHC